MRYASEELKNTCEMHRNAPFPMKNPKFLGRGKGHPSPNSTPS